jgi:hypothetical protein
MPEERPPTPEKHLLNLIEKPLSAGSLKAATIKYHGLSMFSLSALKGRLSFLKGRMKLGFDAKDIAALDIKVLNHFLEICVFCLFFYFIINLLFSAAGMKKDLNIKIKIDTPSEIATAQVSSFLKEVSYYLEKARERDIFKMGVRAALEQAAAVKGPSERMLEATANLKLVGIAWSSDPDVMIEDTKNQRTLFLKKGQAIDQELRLKAVFKDKVILSLGSEEIELR